MKKLPKDYILHQWKEGTIENPISPQATSYEGRNWGRFRPHKRESWQTVRTPTATLHCWMATAEGEFAHLWGFPLGKDLSFSHHGPAFTKPVGNTGSRRVGKGRRRFEKGKSQTQWEIIITIQHEALQRRGCALRCTSKAQVAWLKKTGILGKSQISQIPNYKASCLSSSVGGGYSVTQKSRHPPLCREFKTSLNYVKLCFNLLKIIYLLI